MAQWCSQVIGIGRAPGQYQCMLARACAILRDMSGTNAVLWVGTCPARPALRYATGTAGDSSLSKQEVDKANYGVCVYRAAVRMLYSYIMI